MKKSGWYYRLTLEKKRAMWGVIFLLPWILGFLLFFLGPLYETITYSFAEVTTSSAGVEKVYNGFENMRRAFTVDPYFNQFLITMASVQLPRVLIVIIFSMLAAILVNGKYPGRGTVRAIFFIPIIMGTNIAASTIVGNDPISLETAGPMFGGFSVELFYDVLSQTGLPSNMTAIVTGAVTGIFEILGNSGVPVLIFLAGLQSISPSLYEVAKIEGSSAYESFWKVTLPMLSPMVLLSTVYTIIDAFSRHSIMANGREMPFLSYVRDSIMANGNYGLASAMVLIYMLATVLIVSLFSAVISRMVFYYD